LGVVQKINSEGNKQVQQEVWDKVRAFRDVPESVRFVQDTADGEILIKLWGAEQRNI
jgi:hypothetical protein